MNTSTSSAKISIIIPTLNEESEIEHTITALKSKFSLPHEIIISDGKSTDRTVEIARKFADKVVEYKGEKRQTIGQGRNDGAAASTGDYLVFMDADCTIENPDAFFTHALEDFRSMNLVALGAWLSVLPSEATRADKLIFGFNNVTQVVSNNYLHKGFAPGEFQMMTRRAFDGLGGYDATMPASEDLDMFRRLSRIGRTYFDPKLIVYHTGRRAHKIGWPRLLSTWTLNLVWMTFTGRAYSKEWKVVR